MVELYEEKRAQELHGFENMTVVHDLPAIHHYWSKRHLLPKLKGFGVKSIRDLFVSYLVRATVENVTVVSLGAGNCDFEIGLATQLNKHRNDFNFVCLELSPAMLQRGTELAAQSGLAENFSFVECDLNTWRPDAPFDFAVANHSLHHIVELERVLDAVRNGLEQDGCFLINDMIGRNGHMRWPEALSVVEQFWRSLPSSHKRNHQLAQTYEEFVNWDCSTDGFEGVRSQDILPELLKRFQFDLFLGFANVIDVFIDRGFGPNFNPRVEWDRQFIDRIADIDEQLLESGQIKPTHMIGALMKEGAHPKQYKHLTPEFCVRWP